MTESPAAGYVQPDIFDLLDGAAEALTPWEMAIRREYAKAPALSPFSHQPMPYELARDLGARSWSRAMKRALDRGTTT